MKSYQQFFAELKRRHVFRVAAIYGAVSFGLLQVADPLASAMRLPETFVPFVVALLILGFPVALVLAWAFQVTPEGVERTGAAAPGEIEALVAQPASKRWPAGLLALLGVGALIAGAWWAGRTTADSNAADTESALLTPGDPSTDPRPAVAVLPFANMSGDDDQEYFSDGMTEEILGTLSRIEELRVSGRTSTFAYKGQRVDPRSVGEELGVGYVVDGSVRKAGDALRISAQLVNTDDGSQLWTETYDRTLDDIFAIQSEIAGAVAEALRVPLGLDDPADLVRPVADFATYDLYLAARGRMRQRGAAMTDAIRLFEAAIAIDSAWAPAWAGLAEATEIRLWHEENFGGLPPDSMQIEVGLAAAERAARQALSLDPSHASAHVALGNVQRDRFQWTKGEASYRRALALNPDDAEARHQFSELLLAMGRVEESLSEARRAVALDPAPVRLARLAVVLFADARLEAAEQAFRRYRAVNPEGGGMVKARFLYTQRKFDEARAVAVELEEPLWDTTDEAWTRRIGWMRAGDPNAIPAEERGELDTYDWAMLGDIERSARLRVEPLERDLEIRRLLMIWLPVFDSVRPHPIVQDYLRRANLAGATVQRTPPAKRARETGSP